MLRRWRAATTGISPERPAIVPPMASDAAAKAKCLMPHSGFDWQGDQPPRHPWSHTVIYETHVRGLSMHDSAAVRHP